MQFLYYIYLILLKYRVKKYHILIKLNIHNIQIDTIIYFYIFI